ncbi:MAG: hypothetical protein PHV51_03400, partial [Methanosarcinaceae archaeon]|nr:hypothetical protein [Methanosarcinaceae archaeon]
MDTKKFRGSRTCGGGTSKNRRGAGNRGGRGKAGACKHHFVRAMQRGYSYGKHGFKLPAIVSNDVSIVNVGELSVYQPLPSQMIRLFGPFSIKSVTSYVFMRERLLNCETAGANT